MRTDESRSSQHREMEAYFKSYYNKIYAYCYRVVAPSIKNRENVEDIIQDSMLKAIIALDKGTEPKNLIGWFYRIVRNRAVDYIREYNKNIYSKSISLEYLHEFGKSHPIELSTQPRYIEEITGEDLFYNLPEHYVKVQLYKQILKNPLFDKIDRAILIYRNNNYSYDKIRTCLRMNSNNLYIRKGLLKSKLKHFLETLDYCTIIPATLREPQ